MARTFVLCCAVLLKNNKEKSCKILQLYLSLHHDTHVRIKEYYADKQSQNRGL